MKTIFVAGVLILCIGVACSERAFPQRSLAARAAALSADVSQPYWFLGASRKGGSSIQAIQVPVPAGGFAYDSDDDDDENNNGQQAVFSLVQDDDDDSDDDQANELNIENDDEDSEMNGNIVGILAFDEEREVGNYENDDDDDGEESGMETAIILPRSALKNIPDGSVVAVVDDSESTGRAVRRYYYRRRRGGGGKRRRRGGNRRRRRRGGNRRRRRPSIRVVRPSGTRGSRVSNRRRGSNVIRL
ncbi:uncharacterized protein LOC129947895 [Eupeodes corollae]|uniref:uncharacterized protein LOC129947895 n=1 Tax=Eupeodes corollae TaxID=290404 RepID=UPI00249275C6|nr:uncharacterized protein LOC129947895 [Eupeodes corollae]